MTKSVDEDVPHPPCARLVLWGKNLNPQKITAALALSATESFQRGDQRDHETQWPHGVWLLDTQEQVQSLDPIVHIKWLLDKIEPVQAQLAEIIREQALDAHINVFWVMATFNQRLILEPGLAKRIAATNLRLELSIFSPD